jgi:hypothetical protein
MNCLKCHDLPLIPSRIKTGTSNHFVEMPRIATFKTALTLPSPGVPGEGKAKLGGRSWGGDLLAAVTFEGSRRGEFA